MKECPRNTFSYKLKVHKTNPLLRQAEQGLACSASGRFSVRRAEGQLCCAEAEAPPWALRRFVNTHSAMDCTWLRGD